MSNAETYRMRCDLQIGPEWPTADLAEVAHLDRLLGYKGNYMIFAMRESNDLTDAMMTPYIDTTLGVHDPDDVGNWTLEDFADYVNSLREELSAEELAALEADLRAEAERLLTAPRRASEEIIVPTDSLFIEALVHHSHDLEGTAKEVAQAQDALAKTLLTMKAEADRRVQNPTLRSLKDPGENRVDTPLSLTDHMNPFMQYRLWERYLLPEPKPRKRRRRKPVKRADPVPDTPRRPDPIIVFDEDEVVDVADDTLDDVKEDFDDDLMKDQTDIFNRITFVLDGSSIAIDFGGAFGVFSFGAQAFGTGLAAASVLLGTFISMGQGAQATVAAMRKNGFRQGYRYLGSQLVASKGKPLRLSYKKAFRRIEKEDLSYQGQLLGYGVNFTRRRNEFIKGVQDATLVVNRLGDIADDVARKQLRPLRKKYSAQELQPYFVELAHKNRLRLYREVKKRLGFR